MAGCAFGIEQFLYHGVVALSRFCFDLRPARPKTGTAQEMPHKSNVFLVSHTYLLTHDKLVSPIQHETVTKTG